MKATPGPLSAKAATRELKQSRTLITPFGEIRIGRLQGVQECAEESFAS